MCLGVAIEVLFAGESRPPAEDREGDDLATTERGIRTGSAPFGLMRVAKFIDDDVKCGEEGVHVEHEQSVPFPSGLVSKPTLVRGHLPLKSSMDNSHQAFKHQLEGLGANSGAAGEGMVHGRYGEQNQRDYPR